MKKSTFGSLVVVLLFIAIEDGFGQAPKKWYPTTKRPAGTAGTAANGVRGLTPAPQKDEMMSEPVSGRGALCCMTFENKTGYFIDIWFDDVYQGRVSPWQAGASFCLGTYKTFTAQTVGKTQEWNGDFECGAEGLFVLR